MKPAAARPERFDRLDALRGGAIVWMAAFHFCFDLNYYRLLRPYQFFLRDPFWTVQRTCIVTLFVLCAGLGQAVALAGHGPGPGRRLDHRFGLHFGPRFWRRWAQVAGCAVLVSAGSALMFPSSWISFGVLHAMAVMLLLCRLLAPWGGWLWPLGVVAVWLPQVVQSGFFETRWTNWVGLVVHKPVTEDWAPVLPWLGVMLWGLAAGGWLLRHRRGLLAGAVPAVLRPLAVLGRWSLSFYMVHQLVFIGALEAGRLLHWW